MILIVNIIIAKNRSESKKAALFCRTARFAGKNLADRTVKLLRQFVHPRPYA